MAFPNVLPLGSACRALFPTYLPLYLLSKSSPALLERLEGAILGALRLVRGNKRYENHKLYLQVLPSVPSVCVSIVTVARQWRICFTVLVTV